MPLKPVLKSPINFIRQRHKWPLIILRCPYATIALDNIFERKWVFSYHFSHIIINFQTNALTEKKTHVPSWVIFKRHRYLRRWFFLSIE